MNDHSGNAGERAGFSAGVQRARRKLVRALLGGLVRHADAELCAPGGLPDHGIHRILVCRVNHRLGNNVLISSLLRELEHLYPGAEIDIASAGHAARDLYASRFQVHEVACFPQRMVRHPAATLKLWYALCHRHYDLAIDPCTESHSGRLLLSTCNARFKVGFPLGQRASGANPNRVAVPLHMANRGVFLLRRAYAGATATGWPPLDVSLNAEEIELARHALAQVLHDGNALDEKRPIIGVFPNATGDKRLAEAWWSALVTRLQRERPQLRLVNILAQHGHSQLPDGIPALYSSNLRRLASVLSSLQGFISADCGVMHLATAVATPTLGLFTRSDAAKYRPFGQHSRSINVDPEAAIAASMPQVLEWLDQIPVCAPDGCGSAAAATPRDETVPDAASARAGCVPQRQRLSA